MAPLIGMMTRLLPGGSLLDTVFICYYANGSLEDIQTIMDSIHSCKEFCHRFSTILDEEVKVPMLSRKKFTSRLRIRISLETSRSWQS